jgi:hypothetical protein
LSRTISLQVRASTPVVISSEVVAITGNRLSGSMKLSSSALPSRLSPVMRMTYFGCSIARVPASLTIAARIRSAFSMSSQKGSNPCSYPHEPLVSYRINRQFSGWILPLLMIRAFGAHCHQRTNANQMIAALQPANGRKRQILWQAPGSSAVAVVANCAARARLEMSALRCALPQRLLPPWYCSGLASYRVQRYS